MKPKTIAILLLAALCLTLTGCGGAETTTADPAELSSAAESADPTPEETASPEPQETAAPGSMTPFVTVRVDRESRVFMDEEGNIVQLHYAADRPLVEIPAFPQAAAAINKALEEDLIRFENGSETEDGVSGLEEFLAAVGEELTWRQQENSMDGFVPYEMRRDVHVMRADSRVISILSDETAYLGGAHGYTGRSARNFDARTGAELQLEDLSDDPQTFLDGCAQHLWSCSRGGENTLTALTGGYFDGYEKDLPGLLRDGNWYFSDEGLVIIANPYEIAPYASGRIEFTLPYEWIRWELKEEYLPPEYTEEGTVTGEILPGPMEADFSLDDGTDGNGACVFLMAQGTVRDVRITRVTYNDWNNTFTEDSEFWAASDLPDGSTVLLLTWIGDVLPTLKLSFVSAGQKREYYISQSGKDGSLVLLDGTQFLSPPVEITQLLPFSYDVDGDSVQEVIELIETEEEGYRRLIVDGDPLGDVYAADPAFQHLWLTDLDRDGKAELLYSADMGSDDYVTSAWRADTLEPIRFTMETRNGKNGADVTDTVDGRVVFSYGALFLESYTYQLGTYPSARPYELSGGNIIVPGSAEYVGGHGDWEFLYNQTYLELTREIPVTMDDTGEGTLPAGARILLLGTDGTKMRFRTEDGLTGTIMTEYRSGYDGGWFICGVRDTECFEMLPYAG